MISALKIIHLPGSLIENNTFWYSMASKLIYFPNIEQIFITAIRGFNYGENCFDNLSINMFPNLTRLDIKKSSSIHINFISKILHSSGNRLEHLCLRGVKFMMSNDWWPLGINFEPDNYFEGLHGTTITEWVKIGLTLLHLDMSFSNINARTISFLFDESKSSIVFKQLQTLDLSHCYIIDGNYVFIIVSNKSLCKTLLHFYYTIEKINNSDFNYNDISHIQLMMPNLLNCVNTQPNFL